MNSYPSEPIMDLPVESPTTGDGLVMLIHYGLKELSKHGKYHIYLFYKRGNISKLSVFMPVLENWTTSHFGSVIL